jgi:PleD family two-component response regulator
VAQSAADGAAAVLARADQALYRGKAAGRNTVLG